MEESGVIARLGSGHVLQHLSLPLNAFSPIQSDGSFQD